MFVFPSYLFGRSQMWPAGVVTKYVLRWLDCSLCAEKVWKILGRECKPVRYLARFLETYPLFYDERCHWDLGLWILTKHGLRSEKHWNLWSLWKRFQEQSGMTDFRILCFSGKCNTRLALWLYFWSVLAEFWFCHHSVCSTINCILYCCLNLIHQTNWQK